MFLLAFLPPFKVSSTVQLLSYEGFLKYDVILQFCFPRTSAHRGLFEGGLCGGGDLFEDLRYLHNNYSSLLSSSIIFITNGIGYRDHVIRIIIIINIIMIIFIIITVIIIIIIIIMIIIIIIIIIIMIIIIIIIIQFAAPPPPAYCFFSSLLIEVYNCHSV